jgi:hypothetical protein
LEKTNLLCIADNEGATPMDIALYSHLPKMVSLLELYTPVGGGKNTLHKEDTGTKKNTNAMDFLISSCPPCMGKFNKR